MMRGRRFDRAQWLHIAAALLLLLALAGPRWPVQRPRWNHIVFVDVTQSMGTRDMLLRGRAVSRLAFVQQALHDALRDLPCGSRLGLGLFSEYRVLVLMVPVEVCADYDDLIAVINRMDLRMSWAGASEIAKGVYWARRTAFDLAGRPTLMFVTDGHEAPPLRPGTAVSFGEPVAGVRGTLLGVGGAALSPIPKSDPDGQPLGFWQPEDVLQTDPASAGRAPGGNTQTLVDSDGKPVTVYEASGTEHLSSLKEPHLRDIAAGTGLDYRRLTVPADMSAALRDPRLAQQVRVRQDVRAIPIVLALVALLAVHLPPRKRNARTPERAAAVMEPT